MANYNFDGQNNGKTDIFGREETQGIMAKSFMANVFAWMFGALTVTAIVAYIFGTIPGLLDLLIYEVGDGRYARTGLGWVVMLSPLAILLVMGFGINKLSVPALAGALILFSALFGMSLSFIFMFYTLGSIFMTFGVAAAMFGVMAVLGYTTNLDLTKFGSIMLMLLIGLIITSFINWFMHSESLYWIISFAGVAIFTGLTAYDVQKLKRIGTGVEHGSATGMKLAIMGALSLYLDFINLFLYLLRFLGRSRN